LKDSVIKKHIECENIDITQDIQKIVFDKIYVYSLSYLLDSKNCDLSVKKFDQIKSLYRQNVWLAAQTNDLRPWTDISALVVNAPDPAQVQAMPILASKSGTLVCIELSRNTSSSDLRFIESNPDISALVEDCLHQVEKTRG